MNIIWLVQSQAKLVRRPSFNFFKPSLSLIVYKSSVLEWSYFIGYHQQNIPSNADCNLWRRELTRVLSLIFFPRSDPWDCLDFHDFLSRDGIQCLTKKSSNIQFISNVSAWIQPGLQVVRDFTMSDNFVVTCIEGTKKVRLIYWLIYWSQFSSRRCQGKERSWLPYGSATIIVKSYHFEDEYRNPPSSARDCLALPCGPNFMELYMDHLPMSKLYGFADGLAWK